MITVEITSAEIGEAWYTTLMRVKENRINGWCTNNASFEVARFDTFKGVLGEIAVAKYFGKEWQGKFFTLSEYKNAGHISDVAGAEVRTTHWRNGGLNIYRNDKNNVPYVLCTLDEMFRFSENQSLHCPIFTGKEFFGLKSRFIKIIGWSYPENVWGVSKWKQYGRHNEYYRMPQEHLEAISNLQI